MNKIIYGKAATGKTKDYFLPIIKNYANNVIAASSKLEEIEKFSIVNENCEISDQSKVLMIFNGKSEKEKLEIFNYKIHFCSPNTLIAIDEFQNIEFDESTYKCLFTLSKVSDCNIVLVVQNLGQIKNIYKESYEKFISNFELIDTAS